MAYARIAVAFTVLLVLGSAARAGPDEKDVLRIGTGESLRTLDPHLVTGPMAMRVAGACFEGLVRIDPATCEPAPGLAASWTRSRDGLDWTFTLREDARWSDGSPVTAEQVVASLRRALAPHIGSEYASLLHEIRGARAFNTYAAIAKALRGDGLDEGLLGRLRRMRQDAPNRTQRIAFRRWPSAHRILPALVEGPEPLVKAAFLGERERWSPAQFKELISQLARFAERVGRAEGRASSVGVGAPDARTVYIGLERPQPRLLDLLAMPIAAVVPPSAPTSPEAPAYPWWAQPDSTFNGPYRVESYRVGSAKSDPRVRLRRNERYWDAGSVRQERLDVFVVPDAHESLKRFTEERLDWVTEWPRALTAALRKAPTFRSEESAVIYYYLLNCMHPALKDVRVRRALAIAVDREALLRRTRTSGRSARTFVPASMPDYVRPAARLAFDPVHARKLLAEAGFAEGKGLPTIEILYNTAEAHRAIATFVAAQWREHLGLDVVLRHADWVQYQDLRRGRAFAAARAGWIADYPDPADFLELFDGTRPDNDSRWSDTRFDALLKKARSEHRRSERMKILSAAEGLLLTDGVPCIPLYWYRSGDLEQPWVQGFRTRADGAEPGRPGAHNVMARHPLRGLRVERRAK